ncbi:O-antigen translocase [Paenibacillus sp. MBLB4367]|uniref:O-antigen translocase n=1 Tax=Paenibacillus sp. MBLB4367 TaxID=3384767 RepID=UPI00390835FC
MKLLKTSILSAGSTIIKILSGIVVNKIISIYIGPSGIAIIGQFQNVLSMITSVGTGAISAGITKFTAQYNDDLKKRNQFIQASITVTIICSIIVSLFTLIMKDWLSVNVLHSTEYHIIFIIVSISIIFSSLNLLLLALLNGLKEIKIYIAASISGSLVSLLLASVLTIKFQMFGALLAFVLVQSIVFFTTIVFFRRYRVLVDFTFVKNIPRDVYSKLARYSLMTVTSLIAIPVVQILIRNAIIESDSLEAAGFWQATVKISDLYLMVITTALATYYLPRLSEIKGEQELRNEIIISYKIIIPFVLLSSLLMYVLRGFIINILFTSEFQGMSPLFLYQLIGDCFKMCSWVLAYLMIAKSMTKLYIFTEIIFSCIYYLLSIYALEKFGVIGVTMAYAAHYFIYLLTVLYLFKGVFIKNIKK